MIKDSLVSPGFHLQSESSVILIARIGYSLWLENDLRNRISVRVH